MAFLWYLAAPLRPESPFAKSNGERLLWINESYKTNLHDARSMARALVRAGHCISAPWLWSATELADQDDGQRAAGISANLECLERCDGIVLVGHRISPGMREEENHAKRHRLRVVHALDMRWRCVSRFMRLVEDASCSRL